jgi:hypothetical protein
VYGQNIFSDRRKIKNADEQMEIFKNISVGVERNHGSLKEQTRGDEEASIEEILF